MRVVEMLLVLNLVKDKLGIISYVAFKKNFCESRLKTSRNKSWHLLCYNSVNLLTRISILFFKEDYKTPTCVSTSGDNISVDAFLMLWLSSMV